MQKRMFNVAVLALMCTLAAQASIILDANNTEWELSGATTVVTGAKADFRNSGSGVAQKRWALPTLNNGDSRTATTVADPSIGSSTDYYFTFEGSTLDGISVSNHRYVEISYTLTGNWVGSETSHRFYVKAGNTADSGGHDPDNRNKIPSGSAMGEQTILVDLTEGSTTTYTGEWTSMRWDFFNGNDNAGGKTFTINRLTFGNAVSAIPKSDKLRLVDIDGASFEMAGSVATVQATDGALMHSSRWASITPSETDLTGVLPDPQTNADVYWTASGLSIPVSAARYAEVHYTVNGAGFSGDNHRIYVQTSDQGFKGINISDDHLIDGSTGTHSFILDLQSYTTIYTGNWTQFRWDMWNDLGQGGKSITIDKVVLGESVKPVPKPYPHLFFRNTDIPAFRQKVQSGWLQDAFAQMIANADAYRTVSTNPYPMSGAENGTATAGRALNERLNTLALAGMLLDDLSYIDHAIAMCMSAISQTDVNDFRGYNGHLSISDGLHAYAVAYDWLYNYMSPAERTALYDEIIEFMDWVYNNSVETIPYEPTPMSSNHNAVHHGALGLAALVTSTNVSAELERAAAYTEGYFRYARDSTGYNSEGIGYYGYGSLGAVSFSKAYEQAGYGSLIDEYKKNISVPEFVLRYIQPWGGSVVSLNDSTERMDIGSGMMEFVSRNQDRVGLWAWMKMYGPDGDGTYSGPASSYVGMGCTLPYTILFADETLQPLAPADADLPLGKFFDRGGGTFRSSWDDDAALATFTCGPDIHRGHNHRDEGSFTFSAFGEYFVIDPGYDPHMGRAHNCVTVNGIDQDKEPTEYDTYGVTIAMKDYGDAWYMKGDVTEAYPDALDLDHAIRQFMFVKAPQPYMIIRDDIEDAAASATNVFSWLLHAGKNSVVTPGPTAGEFYLEGDAVGGAVCYVKFLGDTQGLTFAETDLSGETFKNSLGITRDFDDYFREFAVNYTGVNPKFTAILVAAKSITDLPEIASSQSINGLQVLVSFPSSGIEDEVLVSDETMDFQRLGGVSSSQGDESMSASEESEEYYLQESISAGDSILDKEYWFDERTAGEPMPSEVSFAGNRFVVNRKAWRSPNTSGSALFDGKVVVDNAGSGLLVHYCGNLLLNGGMELNRHLVVRPHRPAVELTVSDLKLGESGELIFRTLVSNNNVQYLSVDRLSGSGTIQFGTTYPNDINGVWTFTVPDPGSTFNGKIQLLTGELTFGNALSLPDATFVMEPSWDNHVVLANDVEFDRLRFGVTTLLSGTYTTDELNTVLGTDRFSGQGTLTVDNIQDNFNTLFVENNLFGNDALPAGDLEPDGAFNLLEYALGGNPDIDDADVIMPQGYMVETGGTNWMEYVYRRRTDAEARGLHYNLLACTNLVEGIWFSIGQTAESSSGPIDGELGVESVTNQIPATGTALFIKLEVTKD